MAGLRRLSVSTPDVFNLRHPALSQFSGSTPGIYSSTKKGLDDSKLKINLIPDAPPKGILVKPKEEKIQEKKDEEKEEKKFIKDLRLELQFTGFVFLCFILMIVVPLSMIVFGSLYLYSCPAQMMIPIFLLVGGSCFLASILLIRKLHSLAKQEDENQRCFRNMIISPIVFHVGWFFAGCYWIYGAYEPDYINEDSPMYCHKSLYMYSFWFLNSIFLTIILFSTSFAVYIFCGREQSAADSPAIV